MKKTLLILFSISILFHGCGNTRLYKVNQEYQKEKSFYPSFLTTHFPEKIEKLPIVGRLNNDTSSNCIIYMLIEEKHNLHEDSISKIAISHYNSYDSSIIAIKPEGLIEWKPELKVFYDSIFQNGKMYYPIPYFRKSNLPFSNLTDIFSEKSASGLADDIDIYVLESKSGIYWKGLNPSKYMPEGWKNGYSKGVCISEKNSIIIYWLIVW